MKIIPLQCEYINKTKFHCLVTDDYSKVIKWMNKRYDIDYDDEKDTNAYGTTFELNHPKNGMAIVIWLKETVNPSEMIYNAIHECGHVCFKLMNYVGVDADNNSGEHYLYLQEYLAEQIIKGLVDKSKKKPKLAKKKRA